MHINSFSKNKCVECNRCKKICPRNTEVECKKPILWKEGWAKDEEIQFEKFIRWLCNSYYEGFYS